MSSLTKADVTSLERVLELDQPLSLRVQFTRCIRDVVETDCINICAVLLDFLSQLYTATTLKDVYSSSWNLRATERHLPYGITQCYLPPDTGERARVTPAMQADTRFTYPEGMEG